MMENEKDFFKGIEDTLHSYEEAYVPGAWETFQKKRDRKPAGFLFLKIGSAAAVLLLASYAAFMFWAKTPATAPVAVNKPSVQQPVTKPAPSSVPQVVQPSIIDSLSSSTTESSIAKNNIQNTNTVNTIIATAKTSPLVANNAQVSSPVIGKPDTALIARNVIATAKNDVDNTIQNNVAQQDAAVKPLPGSVQDRVIANNNIRKPGGSDQPVYDALINNKSTQSVVPVSKNADERSVSYALVVQPGIGNQKVNYSTGLQVSYKVTDKISVSSGIGISSLNATSSGSSISTRSGNVQNFNLAVSGVEVPLAVQYKTNKGYYVSAGVMGMSVTSNSLQYNYVTQGTMATTMFDKQGLSYSALNVVAENKTEESKEKVANYLGFYIMSAGKKYPIGKKNTLILGPFLRVPFGAVSSEKIRLLQGGVTVGVGF
jgi:hypothetical protein